MKTSLLTGAQVLFYIVLAQIADAIVRWLHLPVSGSIVGIIMLFVLLHFKIIHLEWIERGSTRLISEMLLFFIPAAVGIINYKSIVIQSGFFIGLTIICSTAAVMLCAGLIGQRISGRSKESAS